MCVYSVQSSVNGVYDLKVVWVTNNCDVLDGNVRSALLTQIHRFYKTYVVYHRLYTLS